MRTLFRGKRRLLFATALFALLAVACEPGAPQDFLNHPSGTQAERADGLWDVTFAIAVAVFFIVEGVLVFTVIKFRRRPDREASQFHGNTKLEVILTLIPSLILAGLAVPTVQGIFENAEVPEDPINVTVVARQFWWEYQYEDYDFVTANELHMPVDRPVVLTLLGADDDVIHSFWIPRIGGTQDVVPGRENTLIYTAEEVGEYLGQCKEFCGLSHANMRIRAIVETESDFEQWVADQQEPAGSPTDSLAREGEELFMGQACIGCHAIEGTDAAGLTGPNLTHFASRGTFAGAMFRTNQENLERWVADAPGVKPGVKMPSGIGEMGLTQEQVKAIVAYLLTLE